MLRVVSELPKAPAFDLLNLISANPTVLIETVKANVGAKELYAVLRWHR